MTLLKGKLEKFFHPTQYMFWGLFFICFTFIHFIVINYSIGLNLSKNFFLSTGDTADYINSVERFIKSGKFMFFDDESLADKGYLYAFRTPGFAFVYYPLRLIFEPEVALRILIIFQILFNSLSKYMFCVLGYKWSGKKGVFWLMSGIFLCSWYASYWNSFMITESLALSFLIVGLFLFHKAWARTNHLILVVSGLCFTEAIFLRPFLGICLIPLFPLLIIRTNWTLSFKKLLFFLLPFLVIDGAWIGRNYYHTQQFIPLSKTLDWVSKTDKVFALQIESCKTVPLFAERWLKQAPMYWFNHPEDHRDPQILYPRYFIPDKASVNLLIQAKNNYSISKGDSISQAKRQHYQNLAYEQYKSLLTKYYDATQFYQLKAIILIGKNMLFQPLHQPMVKFSHPLGTRVNHMSIIIESVVNYFVLGFGFFACFIALFRFKKLLFAMALLPILLSVFFIAGLRFIEYRFMFIPYVLSVFFAVELLYTIFRMLKEYFLKFKS